MPGWKSSLYGSYGKLEYSSAASATILPGGATAGSSANWSFWQVGSRTVWTPVQNLDLSVEVMYNSLDTAFAGGPYRCWLHCWQQRLVVGHVPRPA